MIPFGDVPIGAVLPIPFASYASSTGASITLTGLAVTDIEVYKGVSMTQRSSDAGYALMDTDGIDIDSITGIHGFSIDTGDNTDAGFYAAGSYYWVIVSAVTVDGNTVNFIAATFRAVTAEGVAGQPKVDVAAWLGTAAATPTVNGVPEVDVTHWNGTAVTTPPAVNATQISGDSTAADNAEAFFDGTGYAGTNNVIPLVTTTTTATNLTNAPTNGDLTAAMKTSVTTAATAATPTAAAVIGAVGSVTGNVDGNVTGTVAGVTPSTAAQVAAVLTTAITESYRANGTAPTLAQFMSEVLSHLGEAAISGTTKTINKLDHVTAAATFTLDSATDPATVTRAT
jgi:hypothetical protein